MHRGRSRRSWRKAPTPPPLAPLRALEDALNQCTEEDQDQIKDLVEGHTTNWQRKRVQRELEEKGISLQSRTIVPLCLTSPYVDVSFPVSFVWTGLEAPIIHFKMDSMVSGMTNIIDLGSWRPTWNDMKPASIHVQGCHDDRSCTGTGRALARVYYNPLPPPGLGLHDLFCHEGTKRINVTPHGICWSDPPDADGELSNWATLLQNPTVSPDRKHALHFPVSCDGPSQQCYCQLGFARLCTDIQKGDISKVTRGLCPRSAKTPVHARAPAYFTPTQLGYYSPIAVSSLEFQLLQLFYRVHGRLDERDGDGKTLLQYRLELDKTDRRGPDLLCDVVPFLWSIAPWMVLDTDSKPVWEWLNSRGTLLLVDDLVWMLDTLFPKVLLRTIMEFLVASNSRFWFRYMMFFSKP